MGQKEDKDNKNKMRDLIICSNVKGLIFICKRLPIDKNIGIFLKKIKWE